MMSAPRVADDSLGYDFRLSSLFADNKGGERFMHVFISCFVCFKVLCVFLNFKVVCVCFNLKVLL